MLKMVMLVVVENVTPSPLQLPLPGDWELMAYYCWTNSWARPNSG